VKEEEFEAGFMEFRKLVMKLFKKVQLLAPNLTARFLTAAVQQTLARLAHGVRFETVEISMQALYQAGEMASMQGVAYDWIQSLMGQVLESELSNHPHRCPFNAILTPFQRKMNATLTTIHTPFHTPFQRHFNTILPPF